jgi:hypothetical protein
MSAEEALDELCKVLRLRPVTLKPLYKCNEEPTTEFQAPHIKSFMSGRFYEVRFPKVYDVKIGANWRSFNTEREAIDAVAAYERQRGIIREGVSD